MRIISVNTSVIREILHEGSLVPTGIFKQPATGRVRVGGGLVADHGGHSHHADQSWLSTPFTQMVRLNALNGTPAGR